MEEQKEEVVEDLDNITEEETEELETEETPEEPSEEEEKEEPIDLDKISVETREKEDEKIDYGEDIDPDDVKTIGTIVEKQTAGVKKALQEAQDKLEVDQFVQDNPDFAKYKPVIMKYIQHPIYNKIPVKNIAAMVASNDLLKLGAKKEREAQEKANATKTQGSMIRKPSAGETDWTKAPKSEFEKKKMEVLRGA